MLPTSTTTSAWCWNKSANTPKPSSHSGGPFGLIRSPRRSTVTSGSPSPARASSRKPSLAIARLCGWRRQSAEAHNNLGNALRTLGNSRESHFHLQEAIRLKPGYAEAHNNLGITRLQLGEPREAMVCYDRALELRPDYPEARLNRALALLAQGNMEKGWSEYEWRWHGNGLKKRAFAQPEWEGESLPNGTVLLYTEQGLGDTFQFIRYATLVNERVGSVVLEAHANLLPVLNGCPGISQLVPQNAPLPEFTAHCSLLSLPRIFQTKLETIPVRVPYLFPEPERVGRWREVLRSIPGMKIGVAWQGNREFRGDRQRSLALRFFAPLAAIPGVSLVALQKGEGTQQIQEVSEQFHVHTLAGLDESAAFVDSAAVMSQLDLIVTSDTAIAHLAGALGKPVWVVLCAASDWRWLKQRRTRPGIPRCGCSGRSGLATGRRCSSGWRSRWRFIFRTAPRWREESRRRKPLPRRRTWRPCTAWAWST